MKHQLQNSSKQWYKFGKNSALHAGSRMKPWVSLWNLITMSWKRFKWIIVIRIRRMVYQCLPTMTSFVTSITPDPDCCGSSGSTAETRVRVGATTGTIIGLSGCDLSLSNSSLWSFVSVIKWRDKVKTNY